MGTLPWEGPAWCPGVTRGGLPCCRRELRGVGWCLAHYPDELDDLVYELTGARRCQVREGCRNPAKKGTLPPMCKCHGANLGSKQRQQAAVRLAEQRIAARMAEILASHRAGRA
ncbi:MAG TPA: hypothetical protein VME19_17770 [Streptosporangiaceae bacterium]|nr:hypothetical protein [Streptosporangiaceae bacterium]